MIHENKAQIVALLDDVLSAELTAINQYFLHAEMCHNWGFERLHQKIRTESIEEMQHAEALIERILFLEGTPNVTRLGKISVGDSVPRQLESDLQLELEAVRRLNAAIATCREAGDNNTRALLEGILHDEEAHVDWIESQIELIRQVGEQGYLAMQIH